MPQERIVSADSHVNPPKDLWVRDVPRKFKDRAPDRALDLLLGKAIGRFSRRS